MRAAREGGSRTGRVLLRRGRHLDGSDADVHHGQGGDAEIDNFLQLTYADPNDQAAEVIASRSRAVAHKFLDTFYNGDTAVDATSLSRWTTDSGPGPSLSGERATQASPLQAWWHEGMFQKALTIYLDGLTKAIPARQTLAAGANGGALTLGLAD